MVQPPNSHVKADFAKIKVNGIQSNWRNLIWSAKKP